MYGFLALAIAAGLPGRRVAVLAAAAAVILAIGATRLVLGLHYLSDVAAGYAIGGAWLWVGWRWGVPRMAHRPAQMQRD